MLHQISLVIYKEKTKRLTNEEKSTPSSSLFVSDLSHNFSRLWNNMHVVNISDAEPPKIPKVWLPKNISLVTLIFSRRLACLPDHIRSSAPISRIKQSPSFIEDAAQGTCKFNTWYDYSYRGRTWTRITVRFRIVFKLFIWYTIEPEDLTFP